MHLLKSDGLHPVLTVEEACVVTVNENELPKLVKRVQRKKLSVWTIERFWRELGAALAPCNGAGVSTLAVFAPYDLSLITDGITRLGDRDFHFHNQPLVLQNMLDRIGLDPMGLEDSLIASGYWDWHYRPRSTEELAEGLAALVRMLRNPNEEQTSV